MLSRAAAVAVGGVALVLAALTFEAAVLFVPGVALVVVAVLAPAWIWVASRGVRVSRQIHCERVLEEQPLEATIHVRHGWLGLPGCEVRDPLVGGAVSLRISPAKPGPGRTEVRVVARFERRGRRVLGPPVVSLSDALGIAKLARVTTGEHQEVLVLPRTERPRPLGSEAALRSRSHPGAAVAEPVVAIEVDGLRPYRHGTPASRIHWPALARGAGLLERRLRPDGAFAPLVVLDARSPSDGERVDQAVRAAASLTLALARACGCELLLPGERRPARLDTDLGAWPAVHARLALVSGGPQTPVPALLPRAGRVFYVAADLAHRPWRMLDRAPGAMLVVPGELAAELRRPAAFTVSGCVGLALGSAGSRERAA